MRSRLPKGLASPFVVLFLLGPAARHADAAPPGFTEATIAQAVNFVEVVSGERARPAQIRDKVTFQEAVRTGAKSRAELVFPDATIARVGANSVFSFRPERRTFDLKQGCVLFHSPKGKGGGQIRTAAVTAAVTGTTIIVAATPNGGFKLLVLEGTALIKLANGAIVKLTAGQMSYVLPGGNTISPPLNFALADQVQGSDLVSGFESVLPSMPLIDAAILQQQLLLQQGDLNTTGFLIGQVTGDNQINLIPVNAPIVSTGQNPGSPVEGENTGSPGTPAAPTASPPPPYVPTPYDAMLTDTAVNPLDPSHTIGLNELDIPQNFADFCSTLSHQGVTPPANPFDAGLLAMNIDFNNPTINLSAYSAAQEFVFGAVGQARVHGGMTISGFAGKVEIKSHLAPAIDSGAIFNITSPASFLLDSSAGFSLTDVEFNLAGGSLTLQNAIGLALCYFSAGEVSLYGDNSAPLSLSQTQVYQTSYAGADMRLQSPGDIDISVGSYLSSMKGIFIDARDISIDGSTLLTDAAYGLGTVIQANNLLTLNAADIRPRDTIALSGSSIDSTAGTFQTSIGGIFADAGSDISVDGGTWTAAANLEFDAPSITTIGLAGTGNQGIDFDGDNTSITGGSLSAPNSAGSGIWIRGVTAATVDGASLSAARDINIHGGQIDIINASVTVNHPTDPMPQIFVNGTGPVTLNGANLSGTGPVNIQGATLNLLNGQITSGTMTSYDHVNLTATAPNGLLQVKGTTFASPQIRMQADTIRLENINFPNGANVDLDSRLGILAPNPNSRATIVPGAVNYFDGVKYDGTTLYGPHPNINIH